MNKKSPHNDETCAQQITISFYFLMEFTSNTTIQIMKNNFILFTFFCGEHSNVCSNIKE